MKKIRCIALAVLAHSNSVKKEKENGNFAERRCGMTGTTKEIQMLDSIHKNADMGMNSLSHILDMTEDVAFVRVIKRQLLEYQEAWKKSGQMLRMRGKESGKDAPVMTKMMANMMSSLKNMADSSTSKLAEMVLKGNQMGVTELTKEVHSYDGKDQEVLEFARKQLAREELNVEEIKKFL